MLLRQFDKAPDPYPLMLWTFKILPPVRWSQTFNQKIIHASIIKKRKHLHHFKSMVLYFKLTFYLKIAKGILVLSIYCLLNDLFFFRLQHGLVCAMVVYCIAFLFSVCGWQKCLLTVGLISFILCHQKKIKQRDWCFWCEQIKPSKILIVPKTLSDL